MQGVPELTLLCRWYMYQWEKAVNHRLIEWPLTLPFAGWNSSVDFPMSDSRVTARWLGERIPDMHFFLCVCFLVFVRLLASACMHVCSICLCMNACRCL